MDWYDVTDKYRARTAAHEWQRALAALSRLEGDVNNGGYIQFFTNWGRETYVYASQALKKIGATKMAGIIDRCQALIDEHFDPEGKADEDRNRLLSNRIIDLRGEMVKGAGSVLPESVIARLYELSYEFIAYPDDIAKLGLSYYVAHIEDDDSL